MSIQRSVFYLLFALIISLACSSVWADSDKDHERARQALETGRILPLRTILEKIENQFPGQVLEVELESKNEQWIYELKILQSAGKVIKLKVDAQDASIIKRK